MSENAAAQEAAELALDEAGHGPLTRQRAGQEALQLAPDDAVEDALLGAASRVAGLFSAAAMGIALGTTLAAARRLAVPTTVHNDRDPELVGAPYSSSSRFEKP